MRFILPLLLAAAAAAPALAQPPGAIGPAFPPSSVRADNFDSVFDVKVTTTPAVLLLRNQAEEARWDAIVCNASPAKGGNKGSVRVETSARWGYLDPGVCTMFVNFRQMELSTVEQDKEWTAKVYLRTHR